MWCFVHNAAASECTAIYFGNSRELECVEKLDELALKLDHMISLFLEASRNTGRITDLLTSGKLFLDIDLPKPSVDDARFMLCGGPSMLKDLCNILDDRGFQEARHGTAAHYVIERAFVEQ